MTVLKYLIVYFVFCIVWHALSGVAIARVPCANWNSSPFFEKAAAADVLRCVSAGADLGARTEGGWTPLHVAAANTQNPSVVTALLDAGANISARTEGGLTPLHVAAGNAEDPIIVRLLLGAGANILARAEDGMTPLHVAALHSTTPAVVTTLIDAGANLEARTNGEESPASLWVVSHASFSMLGLGMVLINTPDNGDTSGARYTGGWTPLHFAAARSTSPSVVVVLLDAGADIGARAVSNLTPLHLAAWTSETPSVVRVLLDAGADPSARTASGQTPWHMIKDDSVIKSTDVYWRLNEARFK